MRGYTSVTFGCPFDGDVDPARVHDAIVAMGEAGADAVVLGDTTGVGRPEQVRSILEDALRVLPPERLGLHMHDTYERVRVLLLLLLLPLLSRARVGCVAWRIASARAR